MIRFKRILLCITLCGLLSINGIAQKIFIDPTITGNPKDFGGRVNCIHQDKFGFLWIGKETGLFRYDGFQMKPYRFNPSNLASIGSDNVVTIAEDSSGNLWIGTKGGGLNLFDRRTAQFHRFLHNDKNPKSLCYNEVFTIVPDKENFWIGTDGGGFGYFTPRNRSFQNFTQKPDKDIGLQSNKILSIQKIGNDSLLLGTWGGGLHIFDIKTSKISHLGNRTPYSNCNVFCIVEADSGIFWLATWGQGLVEYNIRQNQFSTIVSPDKIQNFRSLFVDKKKGIWVGCDAGLLYFPSRKKPYSLVESETAIVRDVSSIMLDNANTLWLGCGDGTIAKIPSQPKKFNHPSAHFPISKSSIQFILEPDKSGYLWIASEGMLYSFHPKKKVYKTFHTRSGDLISLADFPEENAILCASSQSLTIFYKKTGRFEKLKLDSGNNTDLLTRQIWTVSRTSALNYWIGALGGAYKINFNQKHNIWKTEEILINGTSGGLSPSHYPSCFLCDSENNFWIGTWGGGLNLRPLPQKYFTHLHSTKKEINLSDNFIECLAYKNKNELWAGSHGGLIRIINKGLTAKTYTISDGLPSNRIVSLQVDKKGQIWAGTSSGLSLLTNESNYFQKFDSDDGLPSNIFLPRSSTSDSAGNLYFGTSQGLFWFHPDSLKPSSFIPLASITEIRIHDKPLEISATSPLRQSIEITSKLELNFNQSSFSFQLASLNYVNPKKNKIRYKLKGYDKDWIIAGSNQLANYEDISPGKYEFAVIAANEDGIWNPTETVLTIVIKPHALLSNSALFSYFLFLAISVFIFFLHRKKIRKTLQSTHSKISNIPRKPNHALVQPSEIVLEPAEKQFLQRAISIVEENIADSNFGVDAMCLKMCTSRPQLYRKIQSAVGLSVTEFIKEVRLKRAAQLLRQKPESISEIAYRVGFNDPKYFSKCFKQQFGVSPAQFMLDSERSLPT